MTDIQIIILCTIIIAICACVIHNSTKTIAARLHCIAFGLEYETPKPLQKSPYGIIHTTADDGSFGYCVTKHGEIYRSSKFSSAPVYKRIKDAILMMNTYEKIEGYKLTVLEE